MTEFTVIGTEPCGCKIIRHPDKNMNPFIQYCPKHKAAGQMYAALKSVNNFRISPEESAILVYEALAKAEGKEADILRVIY